MERVRVRPDLELALTVQGPDDAPPLLLIAGAASRKEGWARQLAHFRRSWRVIAYDARGMGESPVVDAPAAMDVLAGDAVGLLDALGIDRAHVWGISMGGKVAQELALGWPERVDRLVLGCTTAGAAHRIGPEPWGNLRAETLTEDLYAELVVPTLFGRRFREQRPHLVEAFARLRRRNPPDPVGVARQWEAHLAFDSWERLPSLEHPTLVITGDADEIVDPANSRVLAERLPDATLVVIPEAGHSFHVEAPQRTHAAVEAFLRDQAS